MDAQQPTMENPVNREIGVQKPKLAIISTYDELCGIASYTKALVAQLEPRYEVTVFELDQYLLRSKSLHVKRAAEEHIRDICAALKSFPIVNVQLEYGIFGPSGGIMFRRMAAILEASRAVVVTLHTVLSGEETRLDNAWRHLKKFRPDMAIESLFTPDLGARTYRLLRTLQKKKPTHIVVHTARDARMLRMVHQLTNVYDHPLVFLKETEARELRKNDPISHFPALANLSDTTKIVGLFGFLSEYKGFETAIRALQWLPEDYHLAIFGAVHPQAVKPKRKIDKYVSQLLNEIVPQRTDPEKLRQAKKRGKQAGLASFESVERDNRKPVADRVHFMGSLSDHEFARGMVACDVVVFPYLEVGQSSSGPISIAVELGKQVLASRTIAYLQFGKYHPGRIEYFDIGNDLELAQKIQHPSRRAFEPARYNAETNLAFYCSILGSAAQ